MASLRIAKSEPPLQVSKWLTSSVLIDPQEMADLFQTMGQFGIYIVTCLTPLGQTQIPQSQFLEQYRHYIESLQQGKVPDEEPIRHLFSAVLSVSDDCFYAMQIDENQQIIRVTKPVIQLQMHKLSYSKVDGKFYSMAFGPDSIFWGIQFSYPQLFGDPITHEAEKITISPKFPNTLLFQHLQRWVRNHTIPTPFLIDERRVNLPIRLGKACLEWINQHPQLIKEKIRVVNLKETIDGSRTDLNRQ